MKSLFVPLSFFAFIILTGCGGGQSASHEGHENAQAKADTAIQSADTAKPVPVVEKTFSTLDPAVSGSIHEMFGKYILVKNALVSDNANGAADAARSLADVLKKLDKSLLTPEQKKLYDENGDDIKEHAEHIGKNAGDIKHQRMHFSQLSEDMYAIAKGFGGGMELYHDHCPMYNDGKGGMWLSEKKEIANPYFGAKMQTCGTVEEIIK